MRIGEINSDNYKAFASLLGLKNTKALDDLMSKGDKSKSNATLSHEEREALLVSLGYVEAGMLAREGDESWKKIVPVPDWIRQAVIDKEREKMTRADGKNGMADGMQSAEEGDETAALMKSYWITLPPEERLSAGWTLQKISQSEAQRLVDYVKSQIPGWNNHDPFDPRILTGTNYGLGESGVDTWA
jgi:hypothetical protein